MNIYYITDSVLDDRVVHATHIDEVSKNLVALGHSVTLYAPTTTKFDLKKSYEIKLVSTPRFLRSVFYQTNLFFRLLRDIFHEKPDILYCRQSQFLFSPALVAKLLRVPIVFEVNGLLIEEIRQVGTTFGFRVVLGLGILNLVERINVRLASGFIVVTDGIKNYLMKTYGIAVAKIIVIPNGVDTEIFKPMASAEVRSKLDLDKKAVYVGYIGSLHVWQGLRHVIEAAKLVCSDRTNVKFLIVGDGGDGDYLTEFIRKNKLAASIELRPAVIHSLIPLYINALDICVSYPLKMRANAASPFKVYEYLSCGKSVVVSGIGGIREEFGQSVTYAEPEDPDTLAKDLITLIDNKERRLQMGEAGRNFIEQGRSWQIVTKKIIDFCETI